MDKRRATVCPICAGTVFSFVRTYKHDWYQCDDCGTVKRYRRPHYPLDLAPLRWLIRHTPLNRIYGSTLLRVQEVVEDEDVFYDLYARIAAAGPKGTKWEPLTATRLADFAKQGIDIAGKSVLEISGGPGFLAQAMQKTAKRVVVTEFSGVSAKGIARHLGIEAVKFDYNSDKIEDCVSGPFDVVLIIYSIAFCNDLRAFLQSLRKLMHDGTVVYVTHSPGTLGVMLRWEFDEYTHTRCWSEETLAKCFAEIGYPEAARGSEGDMAYDYQWYDDAGTRVGALLKRFHRLIGRYYRARALRSNGHFDRRLIQGHAKQIFRKPETPATVVARLPEALPRSESP